MSLIPREEKYFKLLNQLIIGVNKGAKLLVELFEDFSKHISYVEQIKQVELECDKISTDITDKLNSTFITPIDREDIYLLAKELDDIIDMINEMARLTVIYEVHTSTPAACALARTLSSAVSELENAVKSLELRNGVNAYITQIKKIEEQGDRESQAAIQDLFINQKDPIEIIKWLKIYEDMESGIDLCWEVAKTLEAIVVKNA